MEILFAIIGIKIIPNFNEIKEEVKTFHKRISYFRMVSWDIAIDTNRDVVLVEFNVKGQGIGNQFATGPLFGEFTDEILENCKVDMYS